MYKISTAKDKPCHEYLRKRVSDNMAAGVAISDLGPFIREVEKHLSAATLVLNEKYGIINPASPKQVQAYLASCDDAKIFEICHKNGKWTSNKEALDELLAEGFKFGEDMKHFRKVDQIRKSLNNLANAQDYFTGRVNPKISAGHTNRIHYSDPAILSIPKELLWSIIQPRKAGNKLFSIDIKNQEPTILINWLGIEELKEAIIAPEGLYEYIFARVYYPLVALNIHVGGQENKDIPYTEAKEAFKYNPEYFTPVRVLTYDTFIDGKRVKAIETANYAVPLYTDPKNMQLPTKVAVQLSDNSVIYVGVEWPEVQVRQLETEHTIMIQGKLVGATVECQGVYRAQFKTAWNAITYGSSLNSLSRYKSIDVSRLYNYMNEIPGFKRLKALCKKQAKTGERATKTVFGTEVIAYPNLGERDNESSLTRKLINFPMQGTGADMLSLLVKHSDEEFESRGYQADMSLYFTRHDELIVEVSKEFVEQNGESKTAEILRDIFEHQIDDWTPFKVEIKLLEEVDIMSKVALLVGRNDLEDEEE
jgi:hypothetical protein